MLLPHEVTEPHPALRGVPDTSGSFTLSKPWRPAWAEVDLNAIRHNVGLLARLVAPAGLMAVVKADGYGHGSVAAAYAALEAGATWLGVALVEEGVELRDAGIDAPILLLSQPPVEAARAVVDAGLTPVVHSRRFVDALAKAAADAGASTRSPSTSRSTPACTASAARRARRSTWPRRSRSTGSCTSRASSPTSPWPTSRTTPTPPARWPRFEAVRKELARSGIRPPLVHAANSAGVLTVPEARYDLVRCGISIYGIAARRRAGGAGCRSSRRSASRPGSATSATSWPASGCPTACATSSTCPRPWSRSRSATPTACPAGSARSAARS